jgi:hypothetical protein
MRVQMTRLFAALVVCLAATRAEAHPAPFSYLDLGFTDQAIEGSLVVHMIDIAHDLEIAPVDRLLDDAFVQSLRSRIFGLVTPRMRLTAGRALMPEWQGIDVLREDTALRLRYRIVMPQPGSLTIDTDLFPYDPIHQTFVNIYERGELRQQVIFSTSTGEHTYYLGTTQGALAVMGTFIPSGVHHILIGPDHILFLVGLLLLGGTPLALVRIVTAFTIGHSITLSLAALGYVMPPASIIEPAIALSIVYVGADNLLVGAGGRDTRVWIAFAFGLIHGFGFANVLREMGLPGRALGWSLFGFNVGVEIGQLVFVVLLASLFVWIRARSEAAGRHLAFAGSIVVMLGGTFWFVQRVFFPGGIV